MCTCMLGGMGSLVRLLCLGTEGNDWLFCKYTLSTTDVFGSGGLVVVLLVVLVGGGVDDGF